jgi:hypothetical protein
MIKERSKRPLSSSREKQSPHLSKAICRPRGESVVEKTSSGSLSQSPFESSKLEVKLSNSSLQQTFSSIAPVPEQDAMLKGGFEPLGKKVILPKLRLRERLHKDLDTGTNIFKHRMMKRTTNASIKRTTVLNSKVIRKKTSLEKDSN